MRVVSLLIFLLAFNFIAESQSPQGFNYQAIVRDASGNIRANQGVQFVFEIQDVTGNSVYSEAHTTVTNKYGLADGIVIGKGATVDNFAGIDWGNGVFYVNVKVDGVDMGTSQLMSVPYALYALKAGSGGGGGGGADGVGIQSSVDNGDGTFTLNYTDGTSFTTTNLTGPGGKTILSGLFDPIFSDGIDGLAITEVIKGLILIIILLQDYTFDSLNLLLLITICSILPLYFFNLKKNNKVFLGDSGSLLLGGIISVGIIYLCNTIDSSNFNIVSISFTFGRFFKIIF